MESMSTWWLVFGTAWVTSGVAAVVVRGCGAALGRRTARAAGPTLTPAPLDT